MSVFAFGRGTIPGLVAVLVVAAPPAARSQQPPLAQPQATWLDEIVVTSTGRPEPRSRITGTVQVIDGERITRSSAQSVTDLLAENAVGFFSEWTPGQTSINIRGGASDGQGKDFRSQVLVLVNGRRAGTANLSKLSPADVERIEVIRGPASVIYGSGAMGGVINIILRNGRNTTGSSAEVQGGSWGLLQGRAHTTGQTGASDYYIGLSGGRRDSYRSGAGGGLMANTQWQRLGVTGAFGHRFNDLNRVDLTVRSDGIYNAGFRGSSWNTINRDERTNASFDLVYSGRTASDFGRWTLHSYLIADRDVFRWAAPNSAAQTRLDLNRRHLDIVGTKFEPIFNLFPGNELLIGVNLERSWLRSVRYREGVISGPAISQVAPQDSNQTDQLMAFYAENSQRLFDDRVVLRAGIRHTRGSTSFDLTPNLANQATGARPYTATTYTVGGTWRVTDRFSLRSGLSTGFRAPTATELAGDYTVLVGTQIFGNPNLRPETSRQIEIGGTFAGDGFNIDVALFQNVIRDRINTQRRPGSTTTSDYMNNAGDVTVRGVELQAAFNLLRLTGQPDRGWHWSAFVNGAYNFHMEDGGALPTANSRQAQRMYQYQASIGTRFGQRTGVAIPWSFSVTGILRGPMWYETEEPLLIPAGEPNSAFIHRKPAFWVWNARLEGELRKGLTAYVAVNNIFNVNQHAIFIALDRQPFIGNAAVSNHMGIGNMGSSMPGREVVMGLNAQF
ncbi:TonB-dependent receptor [Phreatobacter sp.]|uniref:TonB-dependent receptor n=1 Tax=Phreatobacter sp. TaxID=1966341 RepID=UPI003F727869